MRWIGQHIWDFISRFRNDVYLEDIDSGTIASGGNLGLDSNNKIVKATITSSSGDIEGVTAGTNLSGGGTTGTVTINLADASDSTKGAASFSSDNFDVSSGAVTIKDAGVDLAAEVTGRLPVANGGTGAASLTDGGILLGSGTAAVTATAVLGDGEILIGDGTTDPVALDVGSSTAITTLGTVSTGTWQGTAIASAYLDSDTAHLSSTQTFSGAKTFSAAEGIVINDATTSSATEGGSIVLASDDGAAMADNHRLGVVEFKGAEDASNTLTTGARIQAICDAAWSATENGASLEFYTTDGNASESVALTLDSNNLATFPGTVEVNNLTVGGAQGNDGQVLTSTGSGVAWEDAAGGSLSGNNFATDLKIGRDADNLLDFTVDNAITFRVGANDGVVMKASGEIEATELDISGAIAMNSDQKLSFGHSSTFIEGATSGSKLMLFGQTDIFLRIALSTVISMDNAKCEFSIPPVPASSDGTALGSTSKMWSDLFLASGGVINFNNGDVTLTHSSNALTIAGGTLTANIANRQIVNLKGYSTLQNDVYEYANSFQNDDEAPFEFNQDYGSGTIGSSTEVTQASMFRAASFHVPFECTLSVASFQASVNGSGGGNVTVALVEYRPSEAGGDTNDYPRTVFVETNVGSNNNNNKIKSVEVDEFSATTLPAGSHLMMMLKGDSSTVGDLAVVSASVALSW